MFTIVIMIFAVISFFYCSWRLFNLVNRKPIQFICAVLLGFFMAWCVLRRRGIL